ncbi:hypothetical protein HPB49_015051 [Dermacentor silvarum]|uniref:Uncharacterized protein n=1 Tax=Dermacentor silvarum TaxID=543639 RepID=A0ACB8CA21_DERSI|nr:hypothetical protein HPB49_015051 [Dermacentor silvarum]
MGRTGTGARNVSRRSAPKINGTADAWTAHGDSAATTVVPAIPGHVDDKDRAGTETLEDIMAFPFRLPAQRTCSDALFTICRKANREYRYSRSANACVEAGAGDVAALLHVCNRSPNRFPSVQVCEKRCVFSERPSDSCLEQPLFAACARQDVKNRWWFFDGRSCLRWDFPRGGCPANNGVVAIFSSEAECVWRCTNPRYPPCRKPASAPCGDKFLKFPAFADVSADDGRVRCLTTLASRPRVRRCLAGSNRYRSKAACEQSCERNTHLSATTMPNRIWRGKGSSGLV